MGAKFLLENTKPIISPIQIMTALMIEPGDIRAEEGET